MDKNFLAKFNIKCLILKYNEEICKIAKNQKWDYQTEMDFIVMNTVRNKFIKNLALSLTGNSLILFQFVEKHGKILYEMIKDNVGDRKVFFVYGNTEVEVRESVRAITDAHKITDQIIFEFDNIKIICKHDELVPLSNGTTKKAQFITENDDIDTSWILKNKKVKNETD